MPSAKLAVVKLLIDNTVLAIFAVDANPEEVDALIWPLACIVMPNPAKDGNNAITFAVTLALVKYWFVPSAKLEVVKLLNVLTVPTTLPNKVVAARLANLNDACEVLIKILASGSGE